MTKWEYTSDKVFESIISSDAIDLINKYGDQGWELVNVVPEYDSMSNSDYQIEEIKLARYALMFKRSKE
ncbi:hypothetical protein GZ22_16860 [Terribacillus saccharophilus]|uniref:DUF4177 domain-containing protein n=1 Tax=Terribacillus saccharophilus TaxID=361277 RepID=A0A075LPV8_9BACI|nr:DUF4177 domain-containing protein [Terribacillus goriensis]AIF68136.1 hypothetical protein GZ22_16860 [Terribacillus goriensis]